MAPACATTTSRLDGSVITAIAPVAPARIAARVPWPPSSSDGTKTTISSPSSPSRAPASRRPRTAARIAATPPFMSHAPRPYNRPSRTSRAPRIGRPGARIARGHDVEVTREDAPSRRVVGTPRPPDHDRQRRPRHLLARPIGVGPNGRRIRLDDLDVEADLAEGIRSPGHHRFLGARDAGDPDERPEVGKQPIPIDRGRDRLSHAGSAWSCRSGRRSR